ncbi:stalk domain-containing protein [Paenibacillus turpanensis]|uniref:stalk domain-containing protein n=1 Tax=Paenibacillus turpanensis TaxID=2689078 RepID=UPI00140B3A24|nr:stalk domain-containing protein [Paenibacillus turpanensis]
MTRARTLLHYLLAGVVALTALSGTASAKTVATSSVFVILYSGQKEAFIGNQQVTLDAAAKIHNGKMYVPARFLAETFGLPIRWEAETNTIHMEPTEESSLIIDNAAKTVLADGLPLEYDEHVLISEDRLLFRLTWIMDYVGAKYKYNSELNRVEIVYTKKPKSLLTSTQNNSRPVAKFLFEKPTYRIGEPVKIIDLSYDVDLEGIGHKDWRGRQDVYFKPGTYSISLQVTDVSGNKSDWYERKIEIVDEVYLDEFGYKMHYNPTSTYIDLSYGEVAGRFFKMRELPKTVTQLKERKLLVSDSPETVVEKGILYQDKVNGKTRLYADHMNGTDERLYIAIMATNNGTEPVTIKTTKQGEVYPSIYANLIGHEATVDFMANYSEKADVIVPPGESQVYALFPEILPEQGINLFYDLETSGETTISFIAFGRGDKIENFQSMRKLPYDQNVRGTFDAADIKWKIDPAQLSEPALITIGDGEIDRYVTGYDAIEERAATNFGNYGVMYHVEMDNPPPMAIMLLARGGVYKGPFKINGEYLMVPNHGGVMTPMDGVHLMWRTTGNEKTLNIEFSPPAGSAFPVDLIFYPLKKE